MENHNNHWPYILAVILVIALVVVTMTKLDGTQARTISSSGTATSNVDPDEVTIGYTIETKAAKAADAQARNAEISKQVREALIKAGVQEKDIETNYFNVYPEYSYEKDTHKPIFLDYRVTHSIKVKSKDMLNSGKLLDVLVNNGVNNVDYVQFGLSDAKQLQVKQDLIAEAARNAREKADAMASGTGSRITGVFSVNEQGFNYPPIMYSMADKAMASSAGVVNTEISPRQIEVSTNVNVVYTIM